MDGVPVIDLSEFASGSGPVRARIAAEVADAVETIGFLTVVGHGTPPDTIARMREGAWKFFRLPLETKLRYLHPARNLNRGYTPFAEEHHGATNGMPAPADLREGYIYGPFDIPEDVRFDGPLAAHAYQKNIWPEAIPGLPDIFRDYYRAVSQFNVTLLEVFAAALDLPQHFFRDKFSRSASTVRVLHYPPQDAPPAPGQLRCGAHTDFGSHTILLADDAPGGLQVLNRAGHWVDAIPPADAFIINIGDMMKMWTNDRWCSNQHRVSNPAVTGADAERLSIAFFSYPNPDALIECIPTCATEDDPPRHVPVLSGDYRRMKIASMTASAQAPVGPASALSKPAG